MKILIDMPKEKYEWIKKNNPNADTNSIVGAVANGIPLNDGAIIDTDCMDEDAKQASIPYTYNATQHDWKCGYPNITRGKEE